MTGKPKMIQRKQSFISESDDWNDFKNEVDSYLEACIPETDTEIQFEQVWSEECGKDMTKVTFLYEEMETNREFMKRMKK